MADPSNQPTAQSTSLAKLVGMVLGERYEIGRVLGEGGMGAVFEGKDLRLGRAVAIKVMQPGYARDAEYAKRFLREAQTASKIRHRNVVVILDYGEAEGGLVYSVMEFLVGEDLEQLLRARPGQRLTWAQAWRLLVQIASGLRAAHTQGVIHRDIKPANCFLTTEDDEPVVKVVDFGIAKLDDAKQTQQLTGTGNVLGTPSYTAPEMVLSGGPASPRSDVYSLGVVAYRMLTGTLPFTGQTAFEVMHHACINPVPPLRERVPELPAAVEQLVLEMLAKKPEERPADMAEVRQRLLALGKRLGGVEAPVLDVGSNALSLDVDVGGSSGETDRTEVLDSGSGERSGPRVNSGSGEDSREGEDSGLADPPVVPTKGATEVVDAAAIAEAVGGKTDVLDAGRMVESMEPAARVVVEDSESIRSELGTTPPVAHVATLVTEDTESSEPSRRAWWLVAGVVFVVAMLGGLGWSMVQRDTGTRVATVEPDESVDSAEPEVVEPESEPEEVVLPEPEVAATGGGSTGNEEVEAEAPVTEVETGLVEPVADDVETGEVDAPALVEESAVAETKPDPPPRPKPSGPPPDSRLKKKLGKKIKARCATEMAGQKVTVSFFVTSEGDPSLLTATPKNSAGDCAKRQISGTKFRARKGETPLKIVVE